MNIIIWLVVGGLIGWAASTLTHMPERIALNVVVGIVGAAAGGWLLSPLFGVSALDQSNFPAASFLGSLIGAALLLVIVNWVRVRASAQSHYVRHHTDTAVVEASTIWWLGASGCAGVIS